jgi:hypothetical protein
VARQLMVHTFDMAAAAATAATSGPAGPAETPTRAHSHSYMRTRSWSPRAAPGEAEREGHITTEAAVAAWASPGEGLGLGACFGVCLGVCVLHVLMVSAGIRAEQNRANRLEAEEGAEKSQPFDTCPTYLNCGI